MDLKTITGHHDKFDSMANKYINRSVAYVSQFNSPLLQFCGSIYSLFFVLLFIKKLWFVLCWGVGGSESGIGGKKRRPWWTSK